MSEKQAVPREEKAAAREAESQEKAHAQERLQHIKHKILVLSGKGGVGKSTVAVNLALCMVQAGKRVGLLDVDIHGPSVPGLLNLKGHHAEVEGEGVAPVRVGPHLKVMSIGFLLKSEDDAVIWRGPLKFKMIQQFVEEVAWGDLDYLVVDCPPGTGDEPLSVAQLIRDADGAVVVTTPQQVAIADVRKAITFCRKLDLPVLGVLENMSGFVCPHCKKTVDIFCAGGGEAMAQDMGVPSLGRVPLDPDIVQSGENGVPYVHAYADSEAAKAFHRAVDPILEKLG